jgi:hypothetical protein
MVAQALIRAAERESHGFAEDILAAIAYDSG